LIYGTLNRVYITLNAYFGSRRRTSLQVYPAPDYTSLGQFGKLAQTTVVVFDDSRALELQMPFRFDDKEEKMPRLSLKRECCKRSHLRSALQSAASRLDRIVDVA